MQRLFSFSLFSSIVTSTFNICRLTIARTVSSKKAMLSKKSQKTQSRLSASTPQSATSLKQFSRWKDYWERSLERIIGKDYWERSTMKVRKLLSQAGEALTNGHGGAEVENFDIDVNGQVALSKELCCANSSFLQNILLFSANCCVVFCKKLCC